MQSVVVIAEALAVSLQCRRPLIEEAAPLSQSLQFQHRHKTFQFKLTDDGAIELYLDNCLRKRRDASEREPQYVWTNVELEWEEHHYIEARYWASSGQLRITVNGDPLVDTEMRVGA